ncbi:aminodeoxychorismate synthase component I [Verrucomicrobia bacterium S94]|nr:aminodeoxychorismate synthase component I [Verrucomicrobia bacterium S94]
MPMKVVLKQGKRWLRFQHPEKVLKAERLEEVLPAIGEAEQSGLYAAGFLSYEAAPAFDPALRVHDSGDFPLLMWGLFRAPEILEDIDAVSSAAFSVGTPEPSVSNEEFTAAIGSIKESIAAGATYQVNYTYRLHAEFAGDAWAFFCALVNGQNTEYAAFIETEDFAICSASPELFFQMKNGIVSSRPMKGTARRGFTFSDDQKQAEALQKSEKDRAENIMIVDMIRNDIGRVAEAGSVETVSTFDVEKYPTVWQMTSTVKGRVASRISTGGNGTFSGVFKALYPCASITGAPKAKTMEIIRSLETSPRKVYTGSIGFITPEGEACFNVAIRTALIQNGMLEFGVGGGIVWDSEAESEYEETLTKARVLTQPRPDFHLLETMLWEPESGIYLLDEHMRRLHESAAYFDIPLDLQTIMRSLENLGCESLRIRLLVSKTGGSEVQRFPVKASEKEVWKIAIAEKPVDSDNVFLYHKTTHRAVYEEARAAFPEYDEVLLWNERGEVTEGTFTNVVIAKDGRKITPPVACGLLGGTFRASLLKAGTIEEGVITLADLKSADEVWLVNSVRKWQKAVLED